MKNLTEISKSIEPELYLKSGCLYVPKYANLDIIEGFEEELLNLDWITKKSARHEYFMSEKEREYSYGNKGLGAEKYLSKEYSPMVAEIQKCLNFSLGTKFNVCFLNKYDDQHQHLGWHSDDFEGMDKSEPIAVISVGAERQIWVKPKGQEKGAIPDNQKILLGNGSLFVMPEGYQDTHFHRIPKHDRPCGHRISLTFRSFLD